LFIGLFIYLFIHSFIIRLFVCLFFTPDIQQIAMTIISVGVTGQYGSLQLCACTETAIYQLPVLDLASLRMRVVAAGVATKTCTANGSWYVKGSLEWTDYRQCLDKQVPAMLPLYPSSCMLCKIPVYQWRRSVVKYEGRGQSGQSIKLFQAPRKISFTSHF